MTDKMRKLHCEERLKKSFDDMTLEDVSKLAGYYTPVKSKKGKRLYWEVTMLWDGEHYTAETQTEAAIIASQQMILGLLLKNNRQSIRKPFHFLGMDRKF